MSEVGGEGGGEMLHIYNSEASSPPRWGPKGPEGAVGGVADSMIIWWIIDILKVVELKNGGHFVTVILTIDDDCIVHLSIRSLEIG